MKVQEIVDRLIKLFREAFDQPNLAYNGRTQMRDIPGFDSVNFVQMILALEADFGIELREEEVDSIYTMGDVFARVREKIPAPN